MKDNRSLHYCFYVAEVLTSDPIQQNWLSALDWEVVSIHDAQKQEVRKDNDRKKEATSKKLTDGMKS